MKKNQNNTYRVLDCNGIEFPQMDNIKGEYNKNIDFFF